MSAHRADAAAERSRRLPLIAGAAAAAAFLLIAVLILIGGDRPLPIDTWWHDLMLSQRTDAGLFIAWIPAIVGGTIPMIVIGIMLLGIFLFLKRRWEAAAVAGTMLVAVGIAAPLAAIAARDRPAGSLAEVVPTSFPSGHSAIAAAVATILALSIGHWLAWTIGILWVVLMAWSRTYLGAHWLSDVIAGTLLGIAVGALVWCGIEAIRLRRARGVRTHPAEG